MIFALSLLVLLFFVGIAIDAGSLYVTYGQLKRAVDAASVSAANEFKRTETLDSMEAAALEVLQLDGVDLTSVNLILHICDEDGDGNRDTTLQSTAPELYGRCPDTAAGQSPRKLVFVRATQRAPLYFLGLLGFEDVQLSTYSISEAAAVDVVIVFDISESMADDTMSSLCTPYWNLGQSCPYVNNYDPYNTDASLPTGCAVTDTCQPLREAKDAAIALISHLYDGYDQVSIVTFDHQAGIRLGLGQDDDGIGGLTHLDQAASAANNLLLHDDPPTLRLWPYWRNTLANPNLRVVNPVNPEDRDGDGSDADPYYPTCDVDSSNPLCCDLDEDRWDETIDPYGWGGFPCDSDTVLDSYDMDYDTANPGAYEYTIDDSYDIEAWLLRSDTSHIHTAYEVPATINYAVPSSNPGWHDSLSTGSTCTGCGLRVASNILREFGRPGAVWVIVFLSDGAVNLSDTYGYPSSGLGDTINTGGMVPDIYPIGFCEGGFLGSFWSRLCFDSTWTPRYCVDEEEDTCPPSTTWDNSGTPSELYSAQDYARDMVDEAALTVGNIANPDEPAGNDIGIYSIGLGLAGGTCGVTVASSELLLRYMAAVGDDGNRDTNPCLGVASCTACGQYYYSQGGSGLQGIFEDIASRIYTRLTD
ncbi:MAG TPA: VWA domain-containing protein [Longilinea sp.]|nr:VWA domain-containing protein [Longilinea sp.]